MERITYRLPEDVLLAIFDFVQFEQLQILVRVSRAWREAGQAHPTFWRDVHFKDEDRPLFSPALILARIQYGLTRKPESNVSFSVECRRKYNKRSGRYLEVVTVLGRIVDVVFRVASLQLVLTADCAAVFLRKLGRAAAPHLRDFELNVVRPASPGIWECIFSSALPDFLAGCAALERVVLCDVPLSAPHGLVPLPHTLKALTVRYARVLLPLNNVFRLFPAAETVELAARAPGVSSLTAAPSMGRALRHLALKVDTPYWYTTLLTLDAADTPSISLTCALPDAAELAALVPRTGDLRMQLRTRPSPTFPHRPNPTGVVTFATRTAVRHVAGIDVFHLKSRALLDALVLAPADRLVALSLSLCITFIALCELRGVVLPRVETLCLALGRLPEGPEEAWEYGRVALPRLRTVVFRTEGADECGYAFSRSALEGFFAAALDVGPRAGPSLKVVLKDVGVMGDTSRFGFVDSFVCEQPSAPWEEEAVSSGFDVAVPPMGWMDDLRT